MSNLIIEIKEEKFSIPLTNVGGFGQNNNYCLIRNSDELKRFTKFLGYLDSEENDYPRVMEVYDESTREYKHKFNICNKLHKLEIEFRFNELYVEW